jgi:hypothetical protein
MRTVEHPAAYANAIKRNIISNARKTWVANTPRANEILDAVGFDSGEGFDDSFMGSMGKSLASFGKLSSKQSEAILRGIDSRAAKKIEWANEAAALNASRTHLGAVGSKITVELTVVHIIVLQGMYGANYIHICEDAEENIVIYKGNASGFPAKGGSATVTATVKEHGVRNGVKQTIIQRPKVAA